MKYIYSALFFVVVLFTTNAQCVLPCSSFGPELAVAGGFEYVCGSQNNFVSDMNLACNNPWPIAANPQGVYHIGNGIQSQWLGTPRTGSRYFIGDALWGTNATTFNRAWAQTINVTAGNTYNFTAYYYLESFVSIQLVITTGSGSTILATSNGPNGQWLPLCATYTATATGSVEIAIRINKASTAYSGADFGLDDISFRQANAQMAVTLPALTICYGNSATLTPTVIQGSGNYQYLWSNGATTSSITVSPLTNQTYTLLVTDLTSGCSVSSSSLVTVNKLNLSIGNNFSICPTTPNVNVPSNVTGGSGNYSYLWNTGATSSSITVNYNNPGTYNLLVTDNTTGCQDLKSIEIFKAVCTGIKYFQNTSSLPASTQFNNITAGYNVTSSIPVGYVSVLSNQTVRYIAGEQINLEPGFTAVSGSNFNAKISPGCTFGNLNIVNTTLNACGNTRLAANIEQGSGYYSYSWSTGQSAPYIDVPNTTATYTLTVTDLCLGNSATVQTQVTQHYKGALSYSAYGNLVTPNGDGYNDLFKFLDNGKTEYAFNATSFTFDVYNRWGALVWSQTKNAPETGFKETDIYWNPNSPYVSDGVYYFSIKLSNCDNQNSEVLKSWVQVIRSLNREVVIEASSVHSDTSLFVNPIEQNLTVFPNPVSTEITIVLPDDLGQNESFTLKISDVLGSEKITYYNLTAGQFNGKLTVADFNDGIYIVEFIYSNGRRLKSKFIKISP